MEVKDVLHRSISLSIYIQRRQYIHNLRQNHQSDILVGYTGHVKNNEASQNRPLTVIYLLLLCVQEKGTI